jgi:glycosyltransferase involved in cell wall biosynthesis
MDTPDVSVIIPTTGRSSLIDAVTSALRQSVPPLEVIVVMDQSQDTVSTAVSDIADSVRVFFSGGIGANGARMHGVAEAKGQIIAFLDDDDVWAPEKLDLQLALWRAAATRKRFSLISSRVAIIDSAGKVLRELPARLLGTQERVAGYLFRRTTLAYGEGLLHTSTLICDRELLELVPWDSGLSRHQDWDWVLRVCSRSDVAVDMCPEVLVGVAVADERSISMSGDWRASRKWLEERTDKLTARERGDFLLCFTAPIAIRSGSRLGGLIAARRALRIGRPGFAAWVVWTLHMLSPGLVDWASALHRVLTQRDAGRWRRPGNS